MSFIVFHRAAEQFLVKVQSCFLVELKNWLLYLMFFLERFVVVVLFFITLGTFIGNLDSLRAGAIGPALCTLFNKYNVGQMKEKRPQAHNWSSRKYTRAKQERTKISRLFVKGAAQRDGEYLKQMNEEWHPIKQR